MDLGLPDVDGLTLIPEIKQIHKGAVIVISGKSSTTDKIVGLEMGADDYMTKPFEMRELVARIKANMRRSVTSSETHKDSFDSDDMERYEFEGWHYNAAKLSLKNPDGEAVELTSGECELLQLFLQSKGRALSREYLFEQTRGDNFDAYDRSIDIQVTRLRKKLDDDPNHSRIIKTVRGVGYMFIADVTKQSAA
jgi:two-component system OmpR family response regulator